MAHHCDWERARPPSPTRPVRHNKFNRFSRITALVTGEGIEPPRRPTDMLRVIGLTWCSLYTIPPCGERRTPLAYHVTRGVGVAV